MFYSQTFLARKGPLGTVWCAAHLQHRLKKSHYTAADIPSTVDLIMFPEVPIALRMSGHLLLGVVRIYSKKVDYLFHDCNIVLIGLRKVFASVQVDLPEDARQAPFQAITLPQTFNLDAMELDGDMCTEGSSDNHLSNQEDITLTDQIPIGGDPYVAITFDEDIMRDASLPEVFQKSGSIQINDKLHGPPEDEHVRSQDPGQHNQIEVPSASAAFQDPGRSNKSQVLESMSNDSSQDFPEIETIRDAPRDFYTENLPPVFSDHRNDTPEMTGTLEEVLNEKEAHTPSLNMLASGVPSMPFQQHSDPPTSAVSKGPPEVSFGCASPQLVIQQSPPVQQPRQRRIPRRRFFDEKLVLPNRLMKRALEDCSDLVRKRRKLPSSALGVWKLNCSQRMGQVFDEPSFTGSCADICIMFNGQYISTKSHLVVPKKVVPEPTLLQSTAPTTDAISELRIGQYDASIPDPRVGFSPVSAPEIECLRRNESNATDNLFPEFGSIPAGSMPSPFRRDDSPFSTNSLQSELAPKAGATSTPDIATFSGTHGSGIDTPMTLLEEQSHLENTGFSAIPEFGSSEADLYFLEEDGNTPTESQGSQGVGSLSVRTRAVAKYLKKQSPITPISEDLHRDLSLNKILEGKTRKICARMFFETLVLKSYGLVDVRQDDANGDITLKLTPTLSKCGI
ncbi:Cohesin subunit rad21, putative isoform 1 [Theobroma cacao]|uniref:Cohesin subunit rad21, putative isoform 1 n=1 Tax=Theobroma cacao TaxID=3641 RepID=A0A061E3C1_THECC|nr:Cohesin subunit rad21, putative isoform 1 [Theobroma cacao]